MVKNKINWQAFSYSNRHETIELLKHTISKNDGYIINFNMFSDLAISLTVEIEENKISNLHRDLARILQVSEPEPEHLNLNSNTEWWILMNISFGKGQGKLKVETPNVPG